MQLWRRLSDQINESPYKESYDTPILLPRHLSPRPFANVILFLPIESPCR
jgi:hypothetical protein